MSAVEIDVAQPQQDVGEDLQQHELATSVEILFDNTDSCDFKVQQIVRGCTLTAQKMKHLERINMSSSDEEGKFPVRAIGEMLKLRADTLVEVYICWGGGGTGTREDYTFFFHQLAQTNKLRKFSFEVVEFMETTDQYMSNIESESWIFKSLADALNKVESLEELHFSFSAVGDQPWNRQWELSPPILFSALQGLCHTGEKAGRKCLALHLDYAVLSSSFLMSICGQNSRVSDLTLCSIRNINHCVAGMAQELQSNPTLERLVIHGTSGKSQLSLASALALVRLLRGNTVVKKLDIQVIKKESDLSATKPLMLAFHELNHLKKLTVSLEDFEVGLGMELECVGVILGGLANNSSLEDLDIATTIPDDAWQVHEKEFNKKLATTLEENTTLKRVRLSDVNCWRLVTLDSTVLFWLKYNEAGRKTLMDRPNDRELWVNKLIEEKEDTRIVFHMLTTNPVTWPQGFGAVGGAADL